MFPPPRRCAQLCLGGFSRTRTHALLSCYFSAVAACEDAAQFERAEGLYQELEGVERSLEVVFTVPPPGTRPKWPAASFATMR